MKERKDLILQKCYAVTQWNHRARELEIKCLTSEAKRADNIVDREIRALFDILREGVLK